MIADIKEITVGWHFKFEWAESGVLIPSAHGLYIYDTDTPILIDCSESGQKPKLHEVYEKILMQYPERQAVKAINVIAYKSKEILIGLRDGRERVNGSNFSCGKSGIFGNDSYTDSITGNKIKIRFYDLKEFKDKGIGKVDDDPLSTARILAAKFQNMRLLVKEKWGVEELPKTLGSLGEKLISRELMKDPEPYGYERYKPKNYPKDPKWLKKLRAKPFLEEQFKPIHLGGKIEAYIRGCIPDWVVYDYDLKSAYGTVQSTLHKFKETPRRFRDPKACYEYLLEHKFCFGICSFDEVSHRDGIRYPVLIQRDTEEDVTVFTLSAKNYKLSSFEFMAAFKDFDRITGFEACIYERTDEIGVIGKFQIEIRKERQRYKEEGNEEFSQFLKLLGNATYGKFAQGYKDKKVIDLKNSTADKTDSKKLNKSQISNLFYSAYITSMVRAIAYETLNELDRLGLEPLYFSTDGFGIPGRVPDSILRGEFGIVSKMVADHVERIFNKRELYELKQAGKGWLSIKSNVFTNLSELESYPMLSTIPGVQVPKRKSKNDFMFDEWKALTRFKETKYQEQTYTPISKWLKGNEYKKEKKEKSFNWDYDFKRKPIETSLSEQNSKVFFKTEPYKSIEEFREYKNYYKNFMRGKREGNKQNRIKNKIVYLQDMEEFLEYIEVQQLNLDVRITKNIHYRILANIISSMLHEEIGYKRLAKLLNKKTSTVQKWMKEDLKFKEYLRLVISLIKKFCSKTVVSKIQNIISKPDKLELISQTINKLSITDTIWKNKTEEEIYIFELFKKCLLILSQETRRGNT
jgi:hypothetical protein